MSAVDGSGLHLSIRVDDVDGDAVAMYKPRVGRQRDRRNRGLRIDAERSIAFLRR